MPYEMGVVVAERHLEAVDPDGNRTTLTVRIGTPARDPEPGGDWYCCFHVTGLGEEQVRPSFGVDSLQALLLAIYGAKINLEERAADAGLRLDWLGQPGYLGLSVDPELHRLIPGA